MFDSVFMWDRSDRDINLVGKQFMTQNRAYYAGGLDRVDDFGYHLNHLRHKGVKRMLIYTHGMPGVLFVRGDHFTGFAEFLGKGYEDAFAPNADIFFAGCEVAQGREGAIFLRQAAEILLFKRGGRAVGWDRPGYFLPNLGLADVFYTAWTNTCNAYMKPGWKRARFAKGDKVASPLGRWEVTVGGKKAEYAFGNDGYVAYYRSSIATVRETSDANVVGHWDLRSEGLTINWLNGQSEKWDVPLYDEFQTGSRGTVEVTAWKLDGKRRVKLDGSSGLP
jgi:hypothetical protein